MKKLVTILIPNYQTVKLTTLCLRLLKKHTDLNVAEVIVIDNQSQDGSLDYLRKLSWITLIERQVPTGEPGFIAHAKALDEALARVTTPYVLSIHTDTLITSAHWLPFLLKKIGQAPHIAGVGSWKLETKPKYKRFFKALEYMWQSAYYKLIGKTQHSLLGQGDNYYYLRSHCALYRTDLLKKYDLHFYDGDHPAGKLMHKKLCDAGYKMVFLSSEVLGQYMDHLNHATMILNPELGARATTVTSGLKRIQKRLQDMNADAILADDTLDEAVCTPHE